MRGFRKHFNFPSLSVANWFPGHMAKGKYTKSFASLLFGAYYVVQLYMSYLGLRKMGLRLQKCNCVLEVHDARVS